MAKDKKVSEDEERRGHDQIQKTTDRFIAKVDELLKKKEQEILVILVRWRAWRCGRCSEIATAERPALGEHELLALVRAQPLPEHVAVIMDGNGRWATSRGLPRVAGHREGVKAARGHRAGGRRARPALPHALRVLHRELEPARGRGLHAHEAPGGVDLPRSCRS